MGDLPPLPSDGDYSALTSFDSETGLSSTNSSSSNSLFAPLPGSSINTSNTTPSVPNAATTPSSTTSTSSTSSTASCSTFDLACWFGLLVGRASLVVLGLVMILGALYLFGKPDPISLPIPGKK